MLRCEKYVVINLYFILLILFYCANVTAFNVAISLKALENIMKGLII